MTRLTFRKPAAEVAYQKQARDRYLDEGVPDVPSLDLKTAKVRKTSRAIAEQIILKYEWLGTMSKTGLHFGIFFGPYCAGVTCFSLGSGTAGVHCHKKYGIQRDEFSTLCRGACVHWAPVGSNSKLVSWSCRLLRSTKIKVVVAYSDADAGEIGTIYQACNWYCLGKTAQIKQWVSPGRKVFRNQIFPTSLAKSRGKTYRYWHNKLLGEGWTVENASRKYLYAYPIDPGMRKKLEGMAVEYPKRADPGG